jgi:hypothetical protein
MDSKQTAAREIYPISYEFFNFNPLEQISRCSAKILFCTFLGMPLSNCNLNISYYQALTDNIINIIAG